MSTLSTDDYLNHFKQKYQDSQNDFDLYTEGLWEKKASPEEKLDMHKVSSFLSGLIDSLQMCVSRTKHHQSILSEVLKNCSDFSTKRSLESVYRLTEAHFKHRKAAGICKEFDCIAEAVDRYLKNPSTRTVNDHKIYLDNMDKLKALRNEVKDYSSGTYTPLTSGSLSDLQNVIDRLTIAACTETPPGHPLNLNGNFANFVRAIADAVEYINLPLNVADLRNAVESTANSLRI